MADKCSIEDCPRNEVGVCELSKCSDVPYPSPDKCSHRNFKIRMYGEKKK